MSEELIKKSDAIKELKDNMVEMGGEDFSEIGVHSDDIDAIINGIPTIDAVPKEDYEALQDAFNRTYNALKTIEPKRGEWIDEADKYDASFGIHDYRCSNCNSYADEYIGGHEWYTADKPNFCPHCGADMRERESE